MASPTAQPMKPSDLQGDAADAVGQQHGGHDAHDQQHVEQRGAFGRHDVAADDGGDVVGMAEIVAERARQDGGREDADAVGPEILQEPRHRGQYRGAAHRQA